MINDEMKHVLVLDPHADDGILGCGGTISKLIRNGIAVSYIIFSICEESKEPPFDIDIADKEAREATGSLGICKEGLKILRFKVRKFSYFRQEILEILTQERKRIDPDLVLIPSTYDTHQDHKVISEEGIRAFKFRSILGYEMPRNNFSFPSNFFIELSEMDVEAKFYALDAYESQKERENYSDPQFVHSLMRFRGGQVNGKWAEAFEPIQLIIK